MSFSSSTKSWQACNGDQRRECKAHAVFNKLHGLPSAVEAYVKDSKTVLLRKIKELKREIRGKLSQEEITLISSEVEIEHLSDVTKLESLFTKIEKFLEQKEVGAMSGKDVKTFLKNRELSKIIKAMKGFSWSGGSNKTPNGKTASDIGISDELLDKLMSMYNGDALLSAWLSAGDENWRRAIEPEIESRKTELAYLKRTDPNNNRIKVLELEISRLEKDWHL